MCRRLRCNIPHHVQQFFDCLHEFLRRAGRREASEEDVERAYREEMLGPHGQIDPDHYESRLKMVLGPGLYRIALELLTEAAVEGGTLSGSAVDRYHERFPAPADADPAPVESVLNVLEHDGYRVGSSRGLVACAPRPALRPHRSSPGLSGGNCDGGAQKIQSGLPLR